MTTTPEPRRRWYQYGLRSLLILMLLVSVGMSWVAVRMQRARRQREALQAIEKAGGSVWYDFEYGQGPSPQPPGPAFLRRVVGEDFFAAVVVVLLNSSPVTDEVIRHLRGLTQLELLGLSETVIDYRPLRN